MDERGRRAALDEVRAEAVGLRLRCAEEKANASALRVEELQAELALK